MSLAAAPAHRASHRRPPHRSRVGLRAASTCADAHEPSRSVGTKPAEKFVGSTNSDLAFIGKYAIQGNYNGFQVWDISVPSKPSLVTSYYCPASQSDVSVYKNLLFVSAEAPSARLDCGGQGVKDTVSAERIRGVRIFDITDMANPKYISNVQTCRGSHTHTVLEDPKDKENVYIYTRGRRAPLPARCRRASGHAGQNRTRRFPDRIIRSSR